MNKQDSLEQLYKEALSSTHKPDHNLNQQLKQRMEEQIPMKKRSNFIFRPVMVAALVALLSISALAAWNLLSPADVAEQLGNSVVAEAFRSDDAILVNKTQSQGGYDVSFLGLVSGKGLSDVSDEVDAAKTYAVVAIAKQNGSMPSVSDPAYGSTPFFVSPLIHGQIPWQYNIASMGGGYSTTVLDGVMYQMIECDDLQMFSDRGLSLVVSSTTFYSVDAFQYDASTGLVAPNPAFEGVNMVFDLPLDTTKANPELAKQYLDELQNPDDASSTDENNGAGSGQAAQNSNTQEITPIENADGSIALVN